MNQQICGEKCPGPHFVRERIGELEGRIGIALRIDEGLDARVFTD
jgi:hypothetical protein